MITSTRNTSTIVELVVVELIVVVVVSVVEVVEVVEAVIVIVEVEVAMIRDEVDGWMDARQVLPFWCFWPVSDLSRSLLQLQKNKHWQSN